MTVTVNGGTPQVLGLTPATDSRCSVTTNGSTLCANLPVAAAPGSDTFALTLYSQANAQGSIVATFTTQAITIVLGQSNTLGTFTLDAVLDHYTLSSPWTWIPGQQAYFPLIVTAFDASGATIIGPGQYVNAGGSPTPISLSLTPGSGGGYSAFSLVTTPLYGSPQAPATTGTLNGPGDVAYIAYNGAAVSAWSLAYGSSSLSLSPQTSPLYQSGVIGFAENPSFPNFTGTANVAQIASESYTVTAVMNCFPLAINCVITVPFVQDGWVSASGLPFVAGATLLTVGSPCSNPFAMVSGTTTASVVTVLPFVSGNFTCQATVFGGGGSLVFLTINVSLN